MAKLAEKISKKARGEKAKGGSKTIGTEAKSKQRSDERQHAKARTKDRGTGSEYAYAVGKALEKGKSLRKEAKESFLGVEKRTVSLDNIAQNRVLYKGDK